MVNNFKLGEQKKKRGNYFQYRGVPSSNCQNAATEVLQYTTVLQILNIMHVYKFIYISKLEKGPTQSVNVKFISDSKHYCVCQISTSFVHQCH